MADRVGQQLANYRLIRLLGQGGFAKVYLGEHVHLGTHVAIKVLNAQLTHADVDPFLTEARTIARLVHPHIVRVFDFHMQDDPPFLVMDYAPNGTLRERHPEGTRVPLASIVSYLNQVAQALQHAHDAKVVHRDVKPGNMLLGRGNKVLLSDFGIAVVAHSAHSQITQEMAGTTPYMAPEQIRGKPCPASDQYALGIVAYEWLCGVRPFRGSLPEIVAQHLTVAPPPLSEKVPSISPAVEQVVMKALAKNPKDRFESVQAFAIAFEEATKLPLPPLPSEPPIIDLSKRRNKVTTQLPAVVEPAPIALPNPQPAPPTPFVPRTTTGTRPPTPIRRSSGQTPAVSPSITPINPIAPPAKRGTAGTRSPQKPKPLRGPVLVNLVAVVVVLLLFGGVAFSARNTLVGFVTSLLPAAATITITPDKKVESTSYVIAAVMRTPNRDQRQVAARLISATQSQSKTVNATGQGKTPGVAATGTLTFYNGSSAAYTYATGTAFTGADGVTVYLDTSVTIPGANFSGTPPTEGSATGTAHATANAGASGNIAAGDINIQGNTIIIKNPDPFSGGQDGGPYTFVQQSDIDGVVKGVQQSNIDAPTQQAQSQVKSQVHPNEQTVDSISCSRKVDSNHQAGEHFGDVTVSVSVTCKQQVYDQQGAQVLATDLLSQKATTDLGPGYGLLGTITVTKTTLQPGTLDVVVNVKGTWVYQFSDAQQTALKRLIAGKHQAEAITILKGQTGVGGNREPTIQMNGTTLPTDPGQIAFKIN